MTYSRLLIPLFNFLIGYRRTALGPVWLLIGPSLFIALLGFLYAEIGAVRPAVFVPHLAVGLIGWTLIQGFVTGSATVFQRARASILQGNLSLDDIVMVEVMKTVLTFLHQIPIILVVLLIYQVPFSLYALVSILGLALLVANGIWFTIVFGILGARYRDVAEVFQAIMRIAFLATPIIWIPGVSDRGTVMDVFLVFNPFYHYLELLRAPLLGNPITPLSWAIVLAITLLGFGIARLITARYARFVPLWV